MTPYFLISILRPMHIDMHAVMHAHPHGRNRPPRIGERYQTEAFNQQHCGPFLFAQKAHRFDSRLKFVRALLPHYCAPLATPNLRYFLSKYSSEPIPIITRHVTCVCWLLATYSLCSLLTVSVVADAILRTFQYMWWKIGIFCFFAIDIFAPYVLSQQQHRRRA